jgi:ketosteroid isomerase-like protein
MKASAIFLSFLISATAFAGQYDPSPQVLIEAEYREYLSDFVAKDYKAIASHFNPPIQRTNSEGSLVLQTKEEIVSMYQSMMRNIQEGYRYSEIDSMDIQAMSSDTYAADVSFTRYNADDEIIFKGRSIYLFGNQSGEWKMFSMIQAARE